MKTKIIFWTLTVLLIVFGCLVGGEIVLRVYNLVSGRFKHIWIPDPVIGYRHTSNNKFVYTLQEPDQTIKNTFTTNSMGLLNGHITMEKPSDLFRVIVLGDSYTEALQVPQDKSFSALLEQELKRFFHDAGSSKRVEVINAGVSGFSPISHYLYFISELFQLNPDVVIQQIYANDVHNDNEATAMSVLDHDGLPVKINRYFFESMYNRRLAPEEIWPKDKFAGPKRFLVKHSRLAEYIYIRWEKSHKRSALQKKMKGLPEFSHHNYFFIVQPGNPLFQNILFREKAVGLTKKYILALKNAVEQQGSAFLMFYIPLHEQIPTSEQREQFYFSQPANTYFNEVLAEFTQANHIPFVDMQPVVSQYPMEECFLKRDSHLTERGHEIVSAALLDLMRQQGMIQK